MGCLCSKLSKKQNEPVVEIAKQKDTKENHKEESKHTKSEANGSVQGKKSKETGKTTNVDKPKDGSHRRSASGLGAGISIQPTVSRILSMTHGHGTKSGGEPVVAGWPSWLTSVAADAVKGMVPRTAESYEKLEKIGQGTYSTVYKARDLLTKNIVAMKKVKFVNMDPESVRFMAREISILRKLDHPNVMKLQAIVTSRISGSLYLVFDYMEHDLAGLTASPAFTFTESQIKCFMQQLLQGLEHCHNRGVLHRDIKGSNLLVDENGILKIADFGLATTFQPSQTEPMTSRVVTLWYRAPELLLGATDYGVAIDMWSAGAILAELFTRKPILPGRTEVEQIHKIFKLCGSPSEEFWRKSNLPHASSFKPQQPYKKNLANVFKDLPHSTLTLLDTLLAIEPVARGTADSALKSNFFTSKPLPCDPSSLPKFPPSKELDAKRREEEERRRKAESVKGRVETGQKHSKPDNDRQGQSNKSINVKGNRQDDAFAYSNSMIHHSGVRSNKMQKTDRNMLARTYSSAQHGKQLNAQISQNSYGVLDSISIHKPSNNTVTSKNTTDHTGKKNRIHYSGPLMAPGGNMDDMLKEHERQIQEAVRKARLNKKN